MKKTVLIICLTLIALAFAFMFVFTVFFPHTAESDYSLLSEWPEFSAETLFSGEYFSGVMTWFTDHVPGRDRFVDYEARIRGLYGLSEEEEVIDRNPSKNPDDESSTDISNDPSDPVNDVSDIETSVTESSDIEFSDVSFDESSQEDGDFSQVGTEGDAELCDAVLILETKVNGISTYRGLEIFYGSLKNCEVFASTVNSLRDTLPDNVALYSMVVPKAAAYYIWQSSKYASTADNNKNNIDKISEYLSPDIIDVNVYNALGRHADEPIYFRTDHHWSALGAYYAAKVFSEKAGVNSADLEDFEKKVRPGYVGTLYKYSDYSPKLGDNPEDFISFIPSADYTALYYDREDFGGSGRSSGSEDGGLFWDIEDSKKSSWYSTFIRGDRYCVKVKSEACNNGRKLLIVKDSYGNALAPYLLEGFEEIYIVDAREYKRTISETVEEFGITDVLVIECTFSAVGNDYINKLKELCK